MGFLFEVVRIVNILYNRTNLDSQIIKHTMRNFYYAATAQLAALPVLFLPNLASAEITVPKGLTGEGGAQGSIAPGGSGALEGANEHDLLSIGAGFINIFIGLLGIIFVLLVVYAGWLRIASQGEAAKVEKSNKLLIQSTIGMVIIVAAYAISNFLIKAAVQATKAV